MILVSRAKRPPRRTLEGQHVRLELLDPDRHGRQLYEAAQIDDPFGEHYAYLPYGPFADEGAFVDWYWQNGLREDPLFYVFVDRASKRALGVASLMRINPDASSIEIGHVRFPPILQKTRAATEGLSLMMAHAFDDLNYRRLEWKCNAANQASRRAAERLGMSFEGIFRQATISKGHNRDTAWYSILDGEWPGQRARFAAWLSDENFDDSGRQRAALGTATTGA